MSTIIRGSRYTPATFRCPNNLLHSAVRWEQLRASYYESQGQMTRSQNCNTLVRSYKNRIRDEAELTDLTN